MLRLDKLSPEITNAVREEARKYSSFHENSVVRVAMIALSDSAAWFLDQKKNRSYETVEPLFPEVDLNSETVHGELDCYGYSAIKMAQCMHNVTMGYGSTSLVKENEDEAFLLAGNGYGNTKGCVSFLISTFIRGVIGSEPWARVYVSVSGGKSEEDEACAMAAKAVLEGEIEDDDFKIS